VSETTLRVVKLEPRPLTAEAFAEFGRIVGPEKVQLTSTHFSFFTNIATLVPASQPITYVNRHHDHNQIFATFDREPMVVVVAAPKLDAATLKPEDVQAFVTDGSTAIVFHIDTWHLAPRAVGPEPIRALNVQAMELQVHTERVELGPTYGCVVQVDLESKARLVRHIRDSRSRLEQTVSRVDEKGLTSPGPDGWSVKDHLAHVAVWEESLLALLEGRDRVVAVGLVSATTESDTRDVDAENADLQRLHRDRPLADVLATFRETHARVLTALERLNDADLYRPYSHYQPKSLPYNPRPVLGWIVGNTWDHYDEHATGIEKLVGPKGSS